MMINLEIRKLTSLHVVCDDNRLGSLAVYTLCVMMISLEVWKSMSLHVVCDGDKFGILKVYKFTYCVC